MNTLSWLALTLLSLLTAAAHAATPGIDISLNGAWQSGLNRVYTQTVQVPGLTGDPARPADGTLWFRRQVHLPAGDWTSAELTLHGARFAPAVYVNGDEVSSTGGGMAPTVHLLRSAAIRPNATITLEIALQSLTQLDPRDASMVPQPDRWRSDNSSGLWDDVTLHLFRDSRFTRVNPFVDLAARTLTLHTTHDGQASTLRAWLTDAHNATLASTTAQASQPAILHLGPRIHAWSPDHPTLYHLHVQLDGPNHTVLDERTSTWGLREFTTRNKRFYLNREPIELRGGTVVWHRFLRDPTAPDIAWNTAWFERNVHARLKSYGANFLRFHLGLPPERLLDLCDRDGLLVQMEWPFFHGIKASDASMREQWTAWMDVAMRHPSVVIVHAWNETDGAELAAGWKALNVVLAQYPPMVVAHRDTLHIHKYWWSLFENLGLYYDSADQFPRTIMVDEFGGDYLDPNGDPGQYPAVKETFLRFVGRDQTRAMRLQFHAEANARVAEYWRRIGAAGFAPFCILSSPQDGDSWFLGDLRNPQPMPVWDALAAAFSPQSVSLDLWNRNFLPGETITIPLYFFNDRDTAALLHARITITGDTTAAPLNITAEVPAHSRTIKSIRLTLPNRAGAWRIDATLLNHVPGVKQAIVSSWKARTLTPTVPRALRSALIGISPDDAELRSALTQAGLHITGLDDPHATLLATAASTWSHLNDPALRNTLEQAVRRGVPIVMLEAGRRDMGQAGHPGDLGPLGGAPRIAPGAGYRVTQDLFAGIRVSFLQAAEPESHIQPGPHNAALWQNLPRDATWLWNGLRGGLIAPAAEMNVEGLGRDGFLAEWAERGADPAAIQRGCYFAYELAGYYAFSERAKDSDTIRKLRERVTFLAEDAPALKDVIDANAKVIQTDLAKAFATEANGEAQRSDVLASCGKGLTRAAVVKLELPRNQGSITISQLFTEGRLLRTNRDNTPYALRYDPAAEQLVLNLLANALSKS